jgi:signal transduction histidine kinase
MRIIPSKFLLFNLPVAEDEQLAKYKVVFLNNVFFFAGIVAFGLGFVRLRENAGLGLLDFGFAGLAFALLFYLRRHQEKIELVSSLALILSFGLFFAVFLWAPTNKTRSALFFLLSASAFFLKGREAGFCWLIVIIGAIVAVPILLNIETNYSRVDLLTLSLYLIALFFVFNSYETVKVEQAECLRRLNMQLEEKVQERTNELQQANRLLGQLNEELDGKVQERTRQLLAVQDELVRKEGLALLGQVVGSVGHELRNPLGVMNNAVYFLQTVLSDADGTIKEYLSIIQDEIADSERIVSDLLDAVRTKPPHLEVVGVRELLEQTLGKLSIPASVAVKLDLPEALPPLGVDALQIHQVFRNLISNAIEAMPEGGTLEIRAVENKPAGTITASVRDSGSGMAPEILDKLFQPLFTTKVRGIGLGLVVVKNLIQANGGTVKVESEAGKGSVFSVTLPGDASAAKTA